MGNGLHPLVIATKFAHRTSILGSVMAHHNALQCSRRDCRWCHFPFRQNLAKSTWRHDILKQSNAKLRWFGNQNLSVSEEDSGRQWNKKGALRVPVPISKEKQEPYLCVSKGWSFYRALVGPKRTIPCRWHAISAAPIHVPEFHLSYILSIAVSRAQLSYRRLLHKFVHSPSLQCCWQILLSLRATQYVQTNSAAKHLKTCGPSRAPCWNLSNWKVDKQWTPWHTDLSNQHRWLSKGVAFYPFEDLWRLSNRS